MIISIIRNNMLKVEAVESCSGAKESREVKKNKVDLKNG